VGDVGGEGVGSVDPLPQALRHLVQRPGELADLGAARGEGRDSDLARAAAADGRPLVAALGGTYHSGDLVALTKLAPDVVIECTGAPAVISALLSHVSPDSVICLAGVGASRGNDTMKGVGLGLVMQATAMLALDGVASHRAHIYQSALERFDVAVAPDQRGATLVLGGRFD